MDLVNFVIDFIVVFFVVFIFGIFIVSFIICYIFVVGFGSFIVGSIVILVCFRYFFSVDCNVFYVFFINRFDNVFCVIFFSEINVCCNGDNDFILFYYCFK